MPAQPLPARRGAARTRLDPRRALPEPVGKLWQVPGGEAKLLVAVAEIGRVEAHQAQPICMAEFDRLAAPTIRASGSFQPHREPTRSRSGSKGEIQSTR
jgi:hypothetical protein